mgnify:FL=1
MVAASGRREGSVCPRGPGVKIGIISQWYEPETGPAALPAVMARELAARGHEVVVLTGFPNYPEGRIAEGYPLRPRMTEVRDGVTVVRTVLAPGQGRSAWRRVLNYVSFAASSTLLGVPALRDCDVVWVNASPITVASPMLLTRYVLRVPVVCEVSDLWPDTLMASGFVTGQRIRGLIEPVLSVWTGVMYRAADAVVTIAPSVPGLLSKRGVPRERLCFIPKPANERSLAEPGVDRRAEWGIGEQDVVLLYAGSMGRAQGLETLVLAMQGAPEQHFVCLLAGGGTMEHELRSLARNAPNVRLLGRRPVSEMPDLLATADAVYISLADDPMTPYTLPSKTQETLAAGKFALVAGTGDVLTTFVEAGAGIGVAQGDPGAIRAAVRDIVRLGRPELARRGASGRAAYDERYCVRAVTDRAERLLCDIVGEENPREPRAQNFRIRPLQRRDVPAVAALHRASFPEFFLTSLGDGFLREFYAGFLHDRDAVTAILTMPSGEVAGVAVGSTRPDGFFSRLLRRRLLRLLVRSVQAMVKDMTIAPRLLAAVTYRGEAGGEAPEGALLSSICVSPDIQGEGYGTALLAAWEAAASAGGAEAAYLTTDALGNDVVQRFYERAGWTCDREYLASGKRRMKRYRRSLGPVVTEGEGTDHR